MRPALRRRRPLRLSVINVYAKNRRMAALRRRVFGRARPHVVVASEAHTLGEIPGYRRLSGEGRRGGEVAIYVRDDVEVIGWGTRQVTREGRGYVNARSVVQVVVRHGGVEWAVLGIHANPGHRGAARRANVRLLRYVAQQVKANAAVPGRRVVVAGDWNRLAHDDGPDTPRGLAQTVGHELVMHGIDGLTHDPAIDVARSRTFDAPGSNHPGIRYRLLAQPAAVYRARTDRFTKES